MRKTSNYGLALYDKEDKMNITAEENSLNANMQIIDSKLKELENNSSGTGGGTSTDEGDAGISAELSNALKTYFTNMQELFTQLAYTSENHIGNTLVQNAKDVVTALEVKIEQPESGIVQTGNILAITSGVTATQTGSVLAII